MRMHVPVHLASAIPSYLGWDGSHPILSRMGWRLHDRMWFKLSCILL